ncbi:MAG: hypothetical protein J7559_01525 [Cohnella sp.]|nr:hypothetical protein [Cohnella sp.]
MATSVVIYLAPMALTSHSVFVYNPTSAVYASSVSSLYAGFIDPNGLSDLSGFTIVQAPDPASGMSVSISGTTLHFGGTPTMPTSFVVRATDSLGQYADKTYTVNFTPEAVDQPIVHTSGVFVSVDLSGYFVDRDGDGLSYSIVASDYAHSSWIDGNILNVWGETFTSFNMLIGATDRNSPYTALNTVSFAGQNVAPIATSSHSVVVYNPTSAAYVSSVSSLYSSFYDANGMDDIVGFTIVQAPDPASGMSVSINGSSLIFGGTPTMPTSFVVRATDSHGLYVDKTYELNFAPEAIHGPSIFTTGALTYIDLNNYFTDRDGDQLNFFFIGPYYSSYTVFEDINSLRISGSSVPIVFSIQAYDGRGGFAYGSVRINQ